MVKLYLFLENIKINIVNKLININWIIYIINWIKCNKSNKFYKMEENHHITF
jgi:hypothetical protein